MFVGPAQAHRAELAFAAVRGVSSRDSRAPLKPQSIRSDPPLCAVLVIRDAQREELRLAAVRRFENRLLAHLQVVLPGQGVSMDAFTLREQIQRGLDEGPRYGFRTERDLAFLVEFFCVHLGGFTAFLPPKPVRKILYAADSSNDQKREALAHWAAARVD